MTPPIMYEAEVIVAIRVRVQADSVPHADEKARRMVVDHRISPAEILECDASPIPLEAQLTADNIRLWQEMEALKGGTASQRQRHAAQLLPDEDLCQLARDELFKPFAMFARRQKMKPSAIPHPRDRVTGKSTCGEVPPVAWSSGDAPRALSNDQWQTVLRLEVALKEARRHVWLQPNSSSAVRIKLRVHTGTCQSCGGSVAEDTALVEIDWAGRTLSREYVL